MGGFNGRETQLTLPYPGMHPRMFKEDAPAHTEVELTTLSSDPKISVTESEILDKSKGDPLGKLFTALQTTWFIVQYLERWITHQPRTQLEVMTLAYVALNILIYALWWEKPLNIQEPIDVHGRSSARDEDRTRGLHGIGAVLGGAFRLPFSKTNDHDDIVFFSIVFPLVGFLFGGIHCFARWFPFPSGPERVLWRVCAAYCTATPCLVSVTCFIAQAPYDRFPGWISYVLAILGYLLGSYHRLVSDLVSAQSDSTRLVITACSSPGCLRSHLLAFFPAPFWIEH